MMKGKYIFAIIILKKFMVVTKRPQASFETVLPKKIQKFMACTFPSAMLEKVLAGQTSVLSMMKSKDLFANTVHEPL